jgi:hypothetical protein
MVPVDQRAISEFYLQRESSGEPQKHFVACVPFTPVYTVGPDYSGNVPRADNELLQATASHPYVLLDSTDLEFNRHLSATEYDIYRKVAFSRGYYGSALNMVTLNDGIDPLKLGAEYKLPRTSVLLLKAVMETSRIVPDESIAEFTNTQQLISVGILRQLGISNIGFNEVNPVVGAYLKSATDMQSIGGYRDFLIARDQFVKVYSYYLNLLFTKHVTVPRLQQHFGSAAHLRNDTVVLLDASRGRHALEGLRHGGVGKIPDWADFASNYVKPGFEPALGFPATVFQ